jgi:hypothetical protein
MRGEESGSRTAAPCVRDAQTNCDFNIVKRGDIDVLTAQTAAVATHAVSRVAYTQTMCDFCSPLMTFSQS